MDSELKSMHAREILNNPLWEELFNDLSMYYYEQFRVNLDPQMRERIAIAHDMLDDFQTQLEASVSEGMVVPLKAVGDNTDE